MFRYGNKKIKVMFTQQSSHLAINGHWSLVTSVNPGNHYNGRLGCKTKCCQHVYCWVFHDNYTAATEEKRWYNYEKEPVSLDKQFMS